MLTIFPLILSLMGCESKEELPIDATQACFDHLGPPNQTGPDTFSCPTAAAAELLIDKLNQEINIEDYKKRKVCLWNYDPIGGWIRKLLNAPTPYVVECLHYHPPRPPTYMD